MGSNAGEPRADSSSLKDEVESNPFTHFIVSEIYASAAACLVYICARVAAFATEHVNQIMPVKDAAPLQFLEAVLAWGGAFATAAVFLIVTLYQLIILVKRLSSRVTK
jgi:hypothetical protein